MEQKAKAELIAALCTDKHSGFKDEDTAMLEAASDERLEQFRAAADAARNAANDKAKLETDHRNTAARLKVAEERLRASEAEMTEEEFIARAPAKIKKTLEAIAAEEAGLKSELVERLKACGADGEAELKKMDIPELKRLAKYAGLQVRDFSGKGLPRETFASENEDLYEPPRPYDLALKALRETKH